jgi:protein TonB
MKLNLLNWKPLSMGLAASAMILMSSCNNDDSAENSTVTPTDTATIVNPPVSMDTNSLNNLPMTDTAARRTPGATNRKSGKVSVVMPATNKTDKMMADNSGYYNYAEVQPSFSGGQSSIDSYVNNNIEYPQEAIDNAIEGTVNVQFGIDENGRISNVKTLGKKLGYGLDDEAVRVVKNMNKWNAGTVSGKKVKTWMILPITYRLE